MRHPQHRYFPQFHWNMRKISAKRYRRAKLGSGGWWVRMLSVVCLHNNAIVARCILDTNIALWANRTASAPSILLVLLEPHSTEMQIKENSNQPNRIKWLALHQMKRQIVEIYVMKFGIRFLSKYKTNCLLKNKISFYIWKLIEKWQFNY